MIANIWLKSISGWDKILPKAVRFYLILFVAGVAVGSFATDKIMEKQQERNLKKLNGLKEKQSQMVEEILRISTDIEKMTAQIRRIYDENDVEIPQSVQDLMYFFSESHKED